MTVTSGKVLILTGLAALALALAGCLGEPYATDDGQSSADAATSSGTTSGSAGGQGGSMEIPKVEVYDCEESDADFSMIGVSNGGGIPGQYDYEYIPKELTISVGQVVYFFPHTTTMNMTSGLAPDGDGLFKTPQGFCRCLKFNVPGTYPFFSIYTAHVEWDHCDGTITVQ